MNKAKKGFIMYFDNCKRLKKLSPKWRGEVVLVLSEYAEQLGTGENAEAYLREQLGRMPKDAAVALEFLTDDARRDEQKYQETIERRAKNGTAWQKEPKKPAGQENVPPTDDGVWKYV